MVFQVHVKRERRRTVFCSMHVNVSPCRPEMRPHHQRRKYAMFYVQFRPPRRPY